MPTLDELETRPSSLEALVKELAATIAATETRHYRGDADKWAASDMLIFLAGKAGIPKDEFIAMFQNRITASHDAILRGLEDRDPFTAAMLDDREIDDVASEEDK